MPVTIYAADEQTTDETVVPTTPNDVPGNTHAPETEPTIVTDEPTETTTERDESTTVDDIPTVTPTDLPVTPTGATVNPTTPATGTTVPAKCLYQSMTWAAEDLRKYYWCLNDKPRLSTCKEDYYYVNNATVSGCIPAAKMNPACVNLDIAVGPCEGINLKQPQASYILTNFWLCTEAGAEPVELTCVEDKAFIKQDGYLGCFDWATWRSLRSCN
ncbi:GH14073 [Drosophila grimshawi]|uniref:GH14073 n=2 Tax=Drosophila grimshawi TaxID=7222 RepID=B4JY68_DROGR|nr:GH14073 [Drosophila grimshawi]